MDTTYRMVVLHASGMYTYGQTAASPELAKIATGHLLRETIQSNGPRRLGIERTDWTTDDEGILHPHRTVLVEVEPEPGTWDIGPRTGK